MELRLLLEEVSLGWGWWQMKWKFVKAWKTRFIDFDLSPQSVEVSLSKVMDATASYTAYGISSWACTLKNSEPATNILYLASESTRKHKAWS
jgi:hypothetical protein